MDAEVQDGLRFHIGRGADERRLLEDRYAELWVEFGPGMNRLVSSYEALPQAREDLLQDIRLALWMALPRFRGDSSMRTFVYRIAHNRALTHVWRRNAAPVDPLERHELPDTARGPEESAFDRFDQARFEAAMRSLPVPMMQVITLALEEISHREISAILGTSEGNVAVRLNRARALLRQKLGGME